MAQPSAPRVEFREPSGVRDVPGPSGRAGASGRKSARVCLTLGALFASFAVACLTAGVLTAMSNDPTSAFAMGLFGLFSIALAGLLLWLGRRG
jgi:hypothetical protein